MLVDFSCHSNVCRVHIQEFVHTCLIFNANMFINMDCYINFQTASSKDIKRRPSFQIRRLPDALETPPRGGASPFPNQSNPGLQSIIQRLSVISERPHPLHGGRHPGNWNANLGPECLLRRGRISSRYAWLHGLLYSLAGDVYIYTDTFVYITKHVYRSPMFTFVSIPHVSLFIPYILSLSDIQAHPSVNCSM